MRSGGVFRRGFTLAEMVVVVVVIGTLAVIAVPRLSNSIALHRVQAAGRRIVVDLAFAQREAKTSNVAQTVIFHPALDRYIFPTIPHPDHPLLNYRVSLWEEPYSAEIVSVDFGGDNRIIFDVFGVPDSGGSVVISVGNLVRTITVDADTGKASVP